MSLTLQEEQQLERAGLISLFNDNIEEWRGLAKQSYDFNAKNFPEGSVVRRDDVAKTFAPLLEINHNLLEYLEREKLKQKYWVRYFCNLILDRTWATISSNSGSS
jgi:hypothetical protein